MDEKKLQELYALRETYKTYSYKINIFFSLTLDFRLGFVQPRTTYQHLLSFFPPPIQSIQFSYTAEPRIAQRSRQYFAAICAVAGSAAYSILRKWPRLKRWTMRLAIVAVDLDEHANWYPEGLANSSPGMPFPSYGSCWINCACTKRDETTYILRFSRALLLFPSSPPPSPRYDAIFVRQMDEMPRRSIDRNVIFEKGDRSKLGERRFN